MAMMGSIIVRQCLQIEEMFNFISATLKNYFYVVLNKPFFISISLEAFFLNEQVGVCHSHFHFGKLLALFSLRNIMCKWLTDDLNTS